MPELPPILVADDLPTVEVGNWAEEKHTLVAHYAAMFAGAMAKKQWSVSYLDLYAGPGRCQIGDRRRLALTSPTRILGLRTHFDRYIFCDQDTMAADALRRRAARDYPERLVTVLDGDANQLAAQVVEQIPGRDSLGFCFLDPYKMANLRFDTIRTLAARRMDFLVLIPSGMDIHRNERTYSMPGNTAIQDFCGAADWRERWEPARARGELFGTFVVTEFGRAMVNLGYLDPGLARSHIVRMDEKNVLLYHLVLYSKHPLGVKFWEQARKYATPQTGFDFGTN